MGLSYEDQRQSLCHLPIMACNDQELDRSKSQMSTDVSTSLMNSFPHCKQRGIQCEFMTLYNGDQNNIVEWMNRTIQGRIIVMSNHIDQSNGFWLRLYSVQCTHSKCHQVDLSTSRSNNNSTLANVLTKTSCRSSNMKCLLYYLMM